MLRRDRIRLWTVLIVVAVALIYSWPIAGNVNLGLDLKGGAHIVLQAQGTLENPVEEDAIDRLLIVIRNRVDQYGVAEPMIQRVGFDRIIVDLPGVQDPVAALELIGRTAVMEFREVLDFSSAPDIPLVQRVNYDDDEGYQRAQERRRMAMESWENVEHRFAARAIGIEGAIVSRGDEEEQASFYLLGPVLVLGGDLTDASRTSDNWGRPAVSISFNSEGTAAFAAATGRLVGRQLAIVLDGTTISAPVVNSHIRDGNAQITGRFSIDEATRLAIMLRAGALPVAVEIIENRSVGPSLGADSIRHGIQAALAGAIAVLIFMLIYYGFNGFAANVALAVTVLLVFTGLIAFNATLTLPGIAAIILTIGMAVDGNILINERIKEELRAGKTPMAALDAGFRKALLTILDANVTSLIAALALFFFGIGSVRGFGVTLSIGLVASVFSNVIVTRAFLQFFMKRRANALKLG